MRIFKIAFFFSLALIFSNCATYHSGHLTSSAILESNNFRYIERNVKGNSSTSYSFWYLFGGNVKSLNPEDGLAEAAMTDLLSKYPLEDGHSLANLSVNYKNKGTFWDFFVNVTCTVSADVVEYYE